MESNSLLLPRTGERIGSFIEYFNASQNRIIFNESAHLQTSNPASNIQSLVFMIIQLVIFIIIILVTCFGNGAVVFIVWKSPKLHNVGMYLISSLAVCDAMVGLVVMPFKAAFQLAGYWPFNRTVCEVWMFLDVSLCTASIWHLCAIGMDRLWMFSYEMQYLSRRDYKVALYFLLCISVLTFGISVPLVLYPWESNTTTDTDNSCSIPDNIAFTLYSTFGAFYLPFLILIIIYLRMFTLAKRRWANRRTALPLTPSAARKVTTVVTTEEDTKEPMTPLPPSRPKMLANGTSAATILNNCTPPCSPERDPCSPLLDCSSPHPSHSAKTMVTKLSNMSIPSSANSLGASSPFVTVSRMRGRISQWKKKAAEKRERKAITALFTILFTFAACWLPFFLIALIVPLCGEPCQPRLELSLFIDWLGYLNSTLNPIIYALMNDDLRNAYKALKSRRRFCLPS